jgi:WD40 repeat protein
MNTRLLLSCALSLTGLTLGTTTSLAEPPAPCLFKGHAAPICAAVFSPNGKTLVTTDIDGMIKVWDARTGTKRSTIKRFSTHVTQRPARPVTLEVSPDGTTVASSVVGDVPRLWNADTGRERIVLRREPEAGIVMTFSPSGRLLTFRGLTGTVDFWNVDLQPDERRVRVPPYEVGRIEPQESKPAPRVVTGVPSLTFSPDGKTLALIAPDRTIVLWETATGKELARITELTVNPAAQKGQQESGWPGLLSEEQLRALGIMRPLETETGLAFSPDGKTLALGGSVITLWDVRTGKKSRTLPTRATEGFARVAFSADGKTLTSASPASAPFVLRGANLKELWTGEPKKGDDFIGVRFRRWDLDTGNETATAVLRA